MRLQIRTNGMANSEMESYSEMTFVAPYVRSEKYKKLLSDILTQQKNNEELRKEIFSSEEENQEILNSTTENILFITDQKKALLLSLMNEEILHIKGIAEKSGLKSIAQLTPDNVYSSLILSPELSWEIDRESYIKSKKCYIQDFLDDLNKILVDHYNVTNNSGCDLKKNQSNRDETLKKLIEKLEEPLDTPEEFVKNTFFSLVIFSLALSVLAIISAVFAKLIIIISLVVFFGTLLYNLQKPISPYPLDILRKTAKEIKIQEDQITVKKPGMLSALCQFFKKEPLISRSSNNSQIQEISGVLTVNS